jgi:Reverse transcriptase (RNA-dependent DNA polymerase)
VSPVVVVPKPKKPEEIRLCVDMRCANRAIQRERHPSPVIDDVLFAINGAAMFSKIDIRAAYHQIELKEESRVITTFACHVGLFRYKRLNFGISSASEQFQQAIAKVTVYV